MIFTFLQLHADDHQFEYIEKFSRKILILGISCAMEGLWYAWWNVAIGYFLCNEVCNHRVNGKW